MIQLAADCSVSAASFPPWASWKETLHTMHFIWKDTTSFTIFGMKAKKTRKQIYQEVFGKKPGKTTPSNTPLTRKEIDEIVKTHVKHVKTATVVMHVAPLIDGDFTRANIEARRLNHSILA